MMDIRRSRRTDRPRRWLTGLALLGLALVPEPASAHGPVWCHRVRAGDTLRQIARRYGTTLARLVALNDVAHPDALRVGQVLRLPALTRVLSGEVSADGPSMPAIAGDLRGENREADRERLSRMKDLRMVRRFVRAGLLVPVEAATSTWWVSTVPPSLRVARPWTKAFIEQLARAFHAFFGERLKITSLTRTASVQRALRLRNANAAPAGGRLRSTHLTGASVDVSKAQLDDTRIGWLRLVLARLEQRRLLHAIEEFRQPHFHVMVLRRYLPYAETLPSPVLLGGC